MNQVEIRALGTQILSKSKPERSMCSNLFYSQNERDWNCQERSWNVAPLQPHLFVARCPNNTALFSVEKVQCKTQLEHGIAFVLVFRI